jgi:hypothetical protein
MKNSPRSFKTQQDYTTRHSRLRKEGEEKLIRASDKLSAAQECKNKLVIAKKKSYENVYNRRVVNERELNQKIERRGKTAKRRRNLCNEHNNNELW